MTLSRKSDTEWVCDTCQLYGSRYEAEAHAAIEGHSVRELDAGLTARVRAERQRAQLARQSYSQLRSVRLNFIRSRSRWPSLRRARARAWVACWEYHEQLRRRYPQWWRPPYDHIEVLAPGAVGSVGATALDPDTVNFEVRLWDGMYIVLRLEGAELRRFARWLYAGTVSTE